MAVDTRQLRPLNRPSSAAVQRLAARSAEPLPRTPRHGPCSPSSIQEGRSRVRGCRQAPSLADPSDSAVNLLHSAPETESVPTPLPEAAAGATVDRFLQAVRRRQVRAALLESALLGSAAVGFGLALAALLARAWPRGVRWVLLATAALAVGLIAERIWRHWTAAAGNPFRTARLVASRMPGVSLDLLAVLELRRAMENDPSFSTELALAHLRAVDERTAGL